LMTLTDL